VRIAVAGGTGTAGRHAAAAAEAAGHEVRVLSRSRGVDLLSGAGLPEALDGVDAVIDAAKPETLEAGHAVDFFRTAAGNLQREAAARGVRHLVTLSIVGIDRASSFGFYRAQLERERTIREGAVPVTIMRATQFHEFPAQMIARTRRGESASIYDMRSQPVAARTVGHVLAELAAGEPLGRAPDLGGPRLERLVELARTFVERRGGGLRIEPDTESMAGVPADALLPGPGARLEGPGFSEWLESEDAAALTL
jgi:uncharacterized protein YbjT (DUF2867 family)